MLPTTLAMMGSRCSARSGSVAATRPCRKSARGSNESEMDSDVSSEMAMSGGALRAPTDVRKADNTGSHS
eukprot:scaffold141112_cov31-Tisochrysis_lutea.AAC.2